MNLEHLDSCQASLAVMKIG